MRVLFWGTPEFGLPSLEAMRAAGHEIAGVVTNPDRPAGRGRAMRASPVKEWALAAEVPVLQPVRPGEAAFLDAARRLTPDVSVVAAYGRILPREALDLPRLGSFNVHASLLPKYRGAAPVHRAIIAGEPETGVTIIRLVRQMDAGPMLARRRRPIAPDETSDAVEAALAELGAGLLLEAIDGMESGTVIGEAQNHRAATFAPRLSRDDGVIDWRAPAEAIHNLVRGLHPWPHASSVLDGARYLVHRSAVVPGPRDGVSPGTILEATGDRLVVATGRGALAILEVQPEGRRRLSTRAFLAGRRWSRGLRFETPAS